MKTEEAAKDPKKEAEKTTGKLYPKTARPPQGYHAQKRQKLRRANHAQKPPEIKTDAGNDHRTTEGPQAKKNPRNKIKAHSGRNTKPERPARDPESIRTDKKHRTTARTAENSQNHRTNAQKPRHGAKRPKADKIHTKATKRHHGRNMKPTDKRRTQTPENIEKSKIRHLFTWDYKGRQKIKLFFPPGAWAERDTPGAIKICCKVLRKIFQAKKFTSGVKNLTPGGVQKNDAIF